MGRVVHFELAVDDIERAKAFYQRALGWKAEAWQGLGDYTFLITGTEGPGIDGVLILRSAETPPTAVTVDVDSVDKALARITAAGGKVVMPKWPVTGVGYLAYCEDTEGNRFGLMERDESATAG